MTNEEFVSVEGLTIEVFGEEVLLTGDQRVDTLAIFKILKKNTQKTESAVRATVEANFRNYEYLDREKKREKMSMLIDFINLLGFSLTGSPKGKWDVKIDNILLRDRARKIYRASRGLSQSLNAE